MIECRRDIDAPVVIDSDPKAVDKLSVIIGQLVAAKLPGAGIRHDGEETDHEEVHEWHKSMLFAAFERAGDSMRTAPDFVRTGSEVFHKGTPIHHDTGSAFDDFEDGMRMIVRVHTADSANGADVVLANVNSGQSWRIGDHELFDAHHTPTSLAVDRGYAMLPRWTEKDMLGKIMLGNYDPLTCGPDIHHFTQRPLDSVLFRTVSPFGPVTAHGFEPLDRSLPREAYISDLEVYAH